MRAAAVKLALEGKTKEAGGIMAIGKAIEKDQEKGKGGKKK